MLVGIHNPFENVDYKSVLAPIGPRSSFANADAEAAQRLDLSWYDAFGLRVPGDIETVQSRQGVSPTQPVGGKRPEYKPGGGPTDSVPAVEFDNVGEALSLGAILNGLDKAVIVAVAKTDNGAAWSSLFEGGTAWGSHDTIVLGVDNLGQYWAGCGEGAGADEYELGGVDLSGVWHTWIFLVDRAAAPVDKVRFFLDGVEQSPGTDVPAVLGGTFDASVVYMGSRNDGSALPWNGLWTEAGFGSVVPADEIVERLHRAVAYKARLL